VFSFHSSLNDQFSVAVDTPSRPAKEIVVAGRHEVVQQLLDGTHARQSRVLPR
jgi:hypothetical protein